MTYLPPGAHQLFADQHGTASLNQLVLTGLTERQIEQLVDRSALVNVVRGAYASPSVRMTEASWCAALCLGRPDVAISGPTAGRLWGLRKMRKDRRIHLIAPPAANPSSLHNVKTYRTAAIRDSDIEARPDGIRLTSRARTALDLGRHLGPDSLLSVIEQVALDGRLSNEDLREVAADISMRRRPWIRTYLEQIDRRLAGGAAESDGEVRVGVALGELGLRGLVRQYEIRLSPTRFVRFDHAIPGLRWAIEVDLHPRHEETAGRLADAARDRSAQAIGWTVDRITRRQYQDQFDRRLAELATRYHQLQRAVG